MSRSAANRRIVEDAAPPCACEPEVVTKPVDVDEILGWIDRVAPRAGA